jgi:hypothetical protein
MRAIDQARSDLCPVLLHTRRPDRLLARELELRLGLSRQPPVVRPVGHRLGRKDTEQHDDELEQEQAKQPVRARTAPPLRDPIACEPENGGPRCAARKAGISGETAWNANRLSVRQIELIRTHGARGPSSVAFNWTWPGPQSSCSDHIRKVRFVPSARSRIDPSQTVTSDCSLAIRYSRRPYVVGPCR